MINMNYRKILLMFADYIILILSGVFSFFILSFFISGFDSEIKRVAIFTILCSFLSFCGLCASGSYMILWRNVNKKAYLRCLMGVLSGTIISWTISILMQKEIQWQFWYLYCVVSSAGIIVFRILFKTAFLNVYKGSSATANRKRTLIIGAGTAARILINEMLANESCEYHPIGMVDDDTTLRRTAYMNIPMLGATAEIPNICQNENVETILFAIPSCSEENKKRILDICNVTKLEIKIIPYLNDLIFGNASLLTQVKDIRIEDLLGRNPVTFDNEDIEILISGKTVMVTGGGGSIGSELCRQIAKYNPAHLVIIDIYENNAYEIQQELLMEYGTRLNFETIIASVRDYDRMEQIFDRVRPDIVFHAAAHKHVPLMEVSPAEAVKNNVFGTFNCVRLADTFNVKKFVMISTDKAVNPTNVMGATKRCCEMIVQYMSQQKSNTEFVTTRFGNVLGSNGSVIPLFKRQIESGKPVTVTHPEIIRYFMTIPEAVSLVLQAGAMAHGGEIFVLDMGAPVKIVTLAENLIRMYGKKPYTDVKIQFTGLRPGEKLFEEMLMNEEGLQNTANKKIFIGNQIEINPDVFLKQLDKLKQSASNNDSAKSIRLLREIVPTFKHSEIVHEPTAKDTITMSSSSIS